MNTTSIESARAKRQKMSKAAAQLHRISRQVKTPTRHITSEIIDSLPEWCGSDMKNIRTLQRTAGALYFAPVVGTSIDGRLLRDFKTFVGDECFDFIRSSYHPTHETRCQLGGQRLPIAVMAAGSAVLLSTLPTRQLVSMYEAVIGPASLTLEPHIGSLIIRDCDFLLMDKPISALDQ